MSEAVLRASAWRIAVSRACAAGALLGILAGCGGSASPSTTVLPPTIAGTPPTSVTAGSTYSFTPTASGPAGLNLAFSIQNAPGWASFNSSTGELSGTPSASDIGTYANVTITVTDGSASASLAPFTVTVQAAAAGTATLTWTIPTMRTDGTTLNNIAGYRIYYGTTPGAYTSMVTVADSGATAFTVTGLVTGTTYYFVATVYDTNGIESQATNFVSKAVP